MLPVTAAELRGDFYNYKGVATRTVVERIYHQVVSNSKCIPEKILYFDLTNDQFVQLVRLTNTRIPTVDEVVEVLKTVFPDCKIVSIVKNTEYGIEISWS